MAFLSDVHGNLAALEAVVAELQRRTISDIFVAGDLLLGGDEPLEVWRRLAQLNARCTRGASDVALATVDPRRLEAKSDSERAMLERFAKTRAAVGEVVLRRLGALPQQLRLPMVDGRELLMVHGSPGDPLESMSHDLEEEELAALLDDDPADIVVCGGSHVPFERPVLDAQLINVGSVGEAPEGRVAHYTVISPRVDGAIVEQTWVEY
ncbi:MAG: metallophosphatase family protein [Myxococcales bacterium]|nr:metallophosphatase family protein [Myxococcales bacterium]